MEFIDLKTQYQRYKDDIDKRMQAVLEHRQYIMGPEVEELEEKLANYVDVKHCITVSSGTHSLEIALRALEIGPGDEVITVPFSWISTAEVIAAVGATPVFIDIEPETFNLNANQLEGAITEKTKAVIPVSLFGQMPEMEYINEIADKHDIAVIEDGAQSFGATRNGKKSCGASLIGSTSFFPAKPLGCYGDGGALFTDDDDLAEAMQAIRNHGKTKKHHHTHVGVNGRFDTLQAAVILGKWPYFEKEVKKRNKVGARYSELLAKHDQFTTPVVAEANTHVYAQYTLKVNEKKRNDIISGMKESGIPVGVYYPKCFHEQPVFEYLGYEYGDFQESEKASKQVLSLPLHPFLTMKKQEIICERIVELIS